MKKPISQGDTSWTTVKRQVFLSLLLQHSNPHLPEWMLLSEYKAEGQDTHAHVRRHLNAMKLISNEVHESREHQQHLPNAAPDQCPPAFERMPEASHPFRDFYTFFINSTSVEPGDGYLLPVPSHRAEHYTNTLHSFFPSHSFPFQSPKATTGSLIPPPRNRPPHFLPHKILSNVNPTEEIQLQSWMMQKSCLCVFDTLRAWYGYTRFL